MVKRNIKTSISEDGGGVEALNENGKRVKEDQNNDGPKRIKTKSWFRQPTVQELNRLQETENLFNSNLFRLQIDEVLQEVKLKEKTEKKFTEWFNKLKSHLLEIPEDSTEYDLSEQTLFKKLKVKIPVCKELGKTKCMFTFKKFNSVEIVGSYYLGAVINSKLKVDVQVTAPAEIFTKNDSINYRYHKKRAAYLAYIASHLTNQEFIEKLNYTWLNNCETKPVLDLKLAGKLGNHLTVRVNVVCDPEAYKLHRFSPQRNNLREAWLLSTGSENQAEIGPPTPYYNSSILSDLTASANQYLIDESLSKRENLKQAVILLKIWLRQRNLQVSGHVVSLLVVYFVQIKRVNNIMSSYQIVRNIWVALKSLDLTKQGISLHKGDDSPSIEEFHNHFPVVFIDQTGYYNICWQMSKGTYEALRRESSMAVEMLDNGKINSFIPLFMTPYKPLLQFDHILKFKNFPAIKESVLASIPKDAKLNYGVDTFALVSDTLHWLLSKGLGNRADLILPMRGEDYSWSVKKTAEKVRGDDDQEKLSFGIVLNPDNAMNSVEKGPPANLPEAEQFRLFWGEKSELRRFQDGSITETCVWGGDSAAERRTLTKQIIQYLFKLKYDIPPSLLYHVSTQLDCVSARKQFVGQSVLYVEESSLEILQAFDALRRDLRQLTELPLDISAVYGTCPSLSYTLPLPPTPRPPPPAPWRRGGTCLVKSIPGKGVPVIPEYTPVVRGVIELGHSGKWPGEIEAFRCLKAAFHLQIAERLNQQYSLATQAYPNHIDILKNGLVFRLSIAHPKEITILRKEIVNGVAKYRDTEESVKLQIDSVVIPRLRGVLHGLHQKSPSFGPTVCLVKRWLSSHLLSPPTFPDVMVELLCAHVWASSGQVWMPTSPTCGFMRVLETLVNTDWNSEVVVLDFNGDLTREELTTLEQQVSSWSPRPALCITSATELSAGVSESESVSVARAGPTRAALTRAITLARHTLQYIEREVEKFNDNLLGAFIPSYAGYDVLIHLHSSLVPYNAERLDKEPNPRPLSELRATEVIPVVEFDPVAKYLDELRSAYSEFALFFHDRYGGDVIAVLWRPDILQDKELQVLNAHALAQVTVDGETKYKVNTAALVEDFRILGHGLVKDITVM